MFGVLAFFDAEWPMFFKPAVIDGILINGNGVEATIFSQTVLDSPDTQVAFGHLKKVFVSKERSYRSREPLAKVFQSVKRLINCENRYSRQALVGKYST